MGLFDNVKALGNKGLEEGKKYAEITKMNIEITAIKDQIRETKAAIGDIYIDVYIKSGIEGTAIPECDFTQIKELADKVIALNCKIQNLEKKISELSNSN